MKSGDNYYYWNRLLSTAKRVLFIGCDAAAAAVIVVESKKMGNSNQQAFFWVLRPLSMDVHWQSYFFTWNWSIKNSNELKINARFFIPFQCTTLFSFNFDRKWKKISCTTFTHKKSTETPTEGKINNSWVQFFHCNVPILLFLISFISYQLIYII